MFLNVLVEALLLLDVLLEALLLEALLLEAWLVDAGLDEAWLLIIQLRARNRNLNKIAAIRWN